MLRLLRQTETLVPLTNYTVNQLSQINHDEFSISPLLALLPRVLACGRVLAFDFACARVLSREISRFDLAFFGTEQLCGEVLFHVVQRSVASIDFEKEQLGHVEVE